MQRPMGVILAGGQATRMGGGDKGLLQVGGQSLMAHVIARLGPQVDGLALNANGDPARFADLGLPVVADSVDGFAGPLAGATLFIVLEHFLGGMTEFWQFWLGLLLLVVILFARGGIIGLLAGERRHD